MVCLLLEKACKGTLFYLSAQINLHFLSQNRWILYDVSHAEPPFCLGFAGCLHRYFIGTSSVLHRYFAERMLRVCRGFLYILPIPSNKNLDGSTIFCTFARLMKSRPRLAHRMTMNVVDALYRIGTWITHSATAWNTAGESIHSPYLFEWVRMVMYDSHAYYAWAQIEKRREAMLRAPKLIDYVDFGSGANQGTSRKRMVSDIAKTDLEPRLYGELLFRLVNWLGHQVREEEGRDLNIIELGTSLGITAAYLAMADSRNHVLTFDGCPAVMDMARFNWTKLGIRNITGVVGDIDDTLALHLSDTVDIAFIDANHTKEAALRYFDAIAAHVSCKSVVILDDIYHNRDMHTAWQTVCERQDVTSTMDLWKMGLVFFDPDYLHKNYKLRI